MAQSLHGLIDAGAGRLECHQATTSVIKGEDLTAERHAWRTRPVGEIHHGPGGETPARIDHGPRAGPGIGLWHSRSHQQTLSTPASGSAVSKEPRGEHSGVIGYHQVARTEPGREVCDTRFLPGSGRPVNDKEARLPAGPWVLRD